MSPDRPLSPRQEALLLRVVEAYIEAGVPIGSRTLVEQGAIVASPSTVRHELAELELLGMLGHPHTSAGRVPTDRGLSLLRDAAASGAASRPRRWPSTSAARAASSTPRSRADRRGAGPATDLLAVVSAPSLETTVVRHVELVPPAAAASSWRS